MSDNLRSFGARAATPFAGEPSDEFRARVLRQQEEQQERRQLDLAEQSSALNTPDARIRIWERLHEVRMPRDPAHSLMKVIASGTGLTLEQVHEEQRQRLLPPPVVVAVPLAP
jgi:predicted PhzF superfamily epimerase YddE/YHI9